MFEFHGQEYRSVKDCCEQLGVNYSRVIAKKYRDSCTPQEAIEWAMENYVKSFKFQGKEYKSIKDCCEQLDLDYNRVKSKKQRDSCTPQEAIEWAIMKNSVKSFKFQEKEYKSIVDCCKQLNINYGRVRSKKSRDSCTDQEAIEWTMNNIVKKVESFEFHGKIYKSVRDCCKQLNVDYLRVMSKKRRDSCTDQEAIEWTMNNPVKNFKFYGKIYKNVKDCCERLDVDYARVMYKKRRDSCTDQEAIEWVMENHVKKRKPVKNRGYFEFHGKRYKNLKDCCEQLEVSYGSIRYRKNYSKLTLEQAITLLLLESGYWFEGGGKISLKEIAEKTQKSEEFIQQYLLNGGSLENLMQRK